MAAPDDLSLKWLLRFRWVGYLGLTLAVVVASSVLRLQVPVDHMLLAVLLGAVTNLATGPRWVRRGLGGRKILLGLLTIDMLVVTFVLHEVGGTSNPFVLTYLLLLVVAAVTVGRNATLLLFALTALCLVVLTIHPTPLSIDHSHDTLSQAMAAHPGQAHGEHLDESGLSDGARHLALHLHGVPLALIVLGALVLYCVRWALEGRERELRAFRAEQERNARLLELSTLASSAAHDLGTPLSTIAVVAKELERALESRSDAADLKDSVRIIRDQVARSRRVLEDLANDTRAGGEKRDRVCMRELMDEVIRSVSEPERVRVRIQGPGDREMLLPRRSIAGVVVALIENALEASADDVIVNAAVGDGWSIEVVDRGQGPEPEHLERLGRQPLTTKPDGMGIGFFLGKAIMERVGGTLELRSDAGTTRALLQLPPPDSSATRQGTGRGSRGVALKAPLP